MDNIAKALVNLLHATSAVTDLVGTGTGFRCYPGRIPQGDAMPAIRWHYVGTIPERCLAGTDLDEAWSTFTIDAIGDTYDDALELAEAVRDTLEGYVGTPTDTSTHFHQTRAEIEAHGFYADPVSNDTSNRHMLTIALNIEHNTS